MKTRTYLAGSIVAAAIVVWHAFATREQFFPSMVYLSNSKFSVAVLGNLGFALALNLYKLVTFVFLGRLRDFELERVKDKVGQALIETLLAMTIFRQDFTVSFVSQFVALSFIKIFHWIAQDRVDFIETTPNVTRGQHARLVAFLALLVAIDYTALSHSLSKTVSHGVSVHLLFAFEYSVQASTAMATLIKYSFSMIDLGMGGRWTGKSVAVFYLELTLDLLHLIIYAVFFGVVFSTYGIPIHLVRDLYWTIRNFRNRVRDFLRYRRISANMDRRFVDATAEDMERAGHVCIVCREELVPGTSAKRLDCSHVFHLSCLRSWLERQQSCPICRAPVLPTARQSTQQDVPLPAPAPAPPQAVAVAAEAPPEAAENIQQDRIEAMLREELQGHLEGARLRPRRHTDHAPAGAAAADGGGEVPFGAPPPAFPQYHVPYPQVGGNPGMQQQWIPATTMAVFYPAGGIHPLQYAGQQAPVSATGSGQQQQNGSVSSAVPVIPVPVLIPLMSPGALPAEMYQPFLPDQNVTARTAAPTPEQHAAASAIAAAAAAAATSAVPTSFMQPPSGWPYMGWATSSHAPIPSDGRGHAVSAEPETTTRSEATSRVPATTLEDQVVSEEQPVATGTSTPSVVSPDTIQSGSGSDNAGTATSDDARQQQRHQSSNM